MGNTPSVYLLDVINEQINYFTMETCDPDRFRLILAPDNIIQATEEVIRQIWPIQKVHKVPGFVEFKLQGYPGRNINDKENLFVKYLMCSLLQRFYSFGWHLKISTDLPQSSVITNVLIFHKELNLSTICICLSLNSSDKIRVLGPPNIYPLIKQAVMKSWSRGIQGERMYGLSYELKLAGKPWVNNDGLLRSTDDIVDSLNIPIMICEIMTVLFRNGWIFISGIDTAKSGSSLKGLYFRQAQSNEINELELENTNFIALSLFKKDSIRLHRATEDSSSDLVQIMSNPNYGLPYLWQKGIQIQTIINGSLEYKLNDYPWKSNLEEAVSSKRLLMNLFNLLRHSGWNLYATCDLAKHIGYRSTFFFRSKPFERNSCIKFCVSLNETNKIRLINSDMSLIEQVRQAVAKGWIRGIENESDFYGSWQFILGGKPFSFTNSNYIYTQAMMCLILNNIEKRGFRLLFSADVSGKYISNEDNTYTSDLHAWFFES